MKALNSILLMPVLTLIVTVFCFYAELEAQQQATATASAAVVRTSTPVQEQTAEEDPTSPQVEEHQSEHTLVANYPVELSYLLYLPDGYDEQDQWPLMLFLHGAGERGNDLERVKVHGPPKLIEAGQDFPMIVVSPQCVRGRYWEPVSLSALLDDIEANYKVDSSRIYVTGLSMGGFGTWAIAAHSPDRFAAIAPVCGGGDRFIVPRMIGGQMGVHVFHGEDDRVVPIERSQEIVDGFKTQGIDVLFTVYPDTGHDSWTETYANEALYTWMLEHSREVSDDDGGEEEEEENENR
ncbi:MAG: prolyl oligopeptidase family serine peptidase [Planctomycetota bacterium]